MREIILNSYINALEKVIDKTDIVQDGVGFISGKDKYHLKEIVS